MTIREHFCSFDIVFIAKIKKIKAKKGRAHIQVKFKIKKDKLEDNFKSTEEKKLKKWFYLADAGDCYNAKKCSVLDKANKFKKNLLVMAKSGKFYRLCSWRQSVHKNVIFMKRLKIIIFR